MMDFELRIAREKLEREQKERKEKAKLKLERERKAQAEALRQREAVEAAQRTRRLEAAEAQRRVDQYTNESLLAGDGIMFFRILEAVHYDGNGDKIKLPPSCFTNLSEQGTIEKGPMYFRISKVHEEGTSYPASLVQQSTKSTHSGVLEFTASEGSVELPPHVWNNLFSGATLKAPLLEVQYVRLPKGTYVKLQPDDIGFPDLPNHKAILETSLRQHATLSEGDIISASHGERFYRLHVLELKPGPSVSVLETDIEVDILSPCSHSEGANQLGLTPLVLGKAESGAVEEGKYKYYKFVVETSFSEKIASKDVSVEIKFEADTRGGDTDIYVSKHPLIFPTQHQHEWSSHDVGSKTLMLNYNDPNQITGVYSIGVFGFKGITEYTVLVALKDNASHRLGDHVTSAAGADVVECQNCKHYMPQHIILLHEAYCSRHNIVCRHDGCGVVLRKEEAAHHVHCTKCGCAYQEAEMEKHMKIFHAPIQCSCGVFLEKEEMMKHQSFACPLRLITCKFCGDMVPAGTHASDFRDRLRGLSEHESLCGSRTALCDSCGRSVMLKDMDIHRIAVHQK